MYLSLSPITYNEKRNASRNPERKQQESNILPSALINSLFSLFSRGQKTYAIFQNRLLASHGRNNASLVLKLLSVVLNKANVFSITLPRLRASQISSRINILPMTTTKTHSQEAAPRQIVTKIIKTSCSDNGCMYVLINSFFLTHLFN